MKPEAQTEATGESSPPVSRYLPNGLWVPPEANVNQEDASAPNHPQQEGWAPPPMGVAPQNWQEQNGPNANMEGENANNTEGPNNGSAPAPGQGGNAMLVNGPTANNNNNPNGNAHPNNGPSNGPANGPNNMAGPPAVPMVGGGSPTCQMQMPVMNPMMGNQMGMPMQQAAANGGQVVVQGPQGPMAVQMDAQQMQMLQQGGPTIIQTPEGQMQMQMQIMQPMPQQNTIQPPNPNNTSSDSGTSNNALATPNNNGANNSGMSNPSGDSPSLTQPQRLFPGEEGNVTAGVLPMGALPGLNGANKPPSPIDPLKFKTKICRNFSKNGMCSYESSCCFAHGEHELRDPINVQGSPSAMPISPLNPNFVKRSNEHLEAQQQMQQQMQMQQDGGSPGAVPMQPNSPQQPPQQAMLMQLGRMPDGSMVCMPLNSNPGVQMQMQVPMGGSPQAPMGNPGMMQGVVHPSSPVGQPGSPQQMQMGGQAMMMVQQPMNGAPNGMVMGPNQGQPMMHPNGPNPNNANGPNGPLPPQMAAGPQGQMMQIGAYQQVPMQMQVPMGGVRHPTNQQPGQTSPLPQQQA